MEVVEERDWDEDDDCALAVADFELWILLEATSCTLIQCLTYLTGGLNLQRSKSRLEIWDVCFEFVKGGCDACLKLTWVGS